MQDLLNSIPYIYAIKTKKQAKLMENHNNEYIAGHCTKILEGVPVIRRVKEFHIGQMVNVNDKSITIVNFLDRFTILYIDNNELKEMKIKDLRKSIKGSA